MPPVSDHPVHPSTIQKSDARYGCFNRKPYAAGYWVRERTYYPDGRYGFYDRFIEHRLTLDCATARVGEADSHPLCEGCTWKP